MTYAAMNTSTTTARERLAHAQTMLTMAEQAWAGGQGSYETVQKYTADVVLWTKVIENADEREG
jgi:hypothetical protein